MCAFSVWACESKAPGMRGVFLFSAVVYCCFDCLHGVSGTESGHFAWGAGVTCLRPAMPGALHEGCVCSARAHCRCVRRAIGARGGGARRFGACVATRWDVRLAFIARWSALGITRFGCRCPPRLVSAAQDKKEVRVRWQGCKHSGERERQMLLLPSTPVFRN